MRGPIAAAVLAGLAAQASPGDPLIVERSFLTLQGSNVVFDGRASDRREPPGPGDDSGDLHGWGPVEAGDTVFYRAFFLGWYSDGLAAWHAPTRTWRSWRMSALAEAGGWYGAERGPDTIADDVRGLAGTRARVWMGTNGVGIVVLDVQSRRWSRYDVQWRAEPGRQNWIRYADDEYVFASGGAVSRATAADDEQYDAGLQVYSIARDRWVRIAAVPRASVISLATNRGLPVAMPCSQERYDRAAYVPLRECSAHHADRVVRHGDAYEFELTFPPPGVSGRYTLTRNQLDAAFAGVRQ
jgi:hypothetical protein